MRINKRFICSVKDKKDPCSNCKHLGESRIIAIEPPECYFCGGPDYPAWRLGGI